MVGQALPSDPLTGEYIPADEGDDLPPAGTYTGTSPDATGDDLPTVTITNAPIVTFNWALWLAIGALLWALYEQKD
jgi:hypothetical protein